MTPSHFYIYEFSKKNIKTHNIILQNITSDSYIYIEEYNPQC